MKVDDLGEFALIERLVARLPRTRHDVRLGPGDDVAAIDVGMGRLLLATCDVQVAGVHFLPARADAHRLGRKCAAVNLSDLAAAGGRPTHLLVSLVVPPAIEVAFLEALYDGLSQEAARFGAQVVGGNVSRGPSLAIDVTLFGEVQARELLRRGGATVGDVVLVTGTLGAAAAGLHVLLHPDVALDPELARVARDAFETPHARVAEGRALALTGGVGAAIDVSDGLAADLAHLCRSSGVGAHLRAEDLPVSPAARALAEAEQRNAWDLALGGGEDYELLFTAPAARVPQLVAAVEGLGTPVACIGEIVEASRGCTWVDPGGATVALAPRGWRHLAGGSEQP